MTPRRVRLAAAGACVVLAAGCGSTPAAAPSTASVTPSAASPAASIPSARPTSTPQQWASVIARAPDLPGELQQVGDCWVAGDFESIGCALLPITVQMEAETLVMRLGDLAEPDPEVAELAATTLAAAKALRSAAEKTADACPGKKCSGVWAGMDMSGMRMQDQIAGWKPWM